MNSAYQIFEDFYAQDCIFVEVKEMWRQAVRCKASNLVTPSLGGRYTIFQNKIPKQIPPWRWGFILHDGIHQIS